MMGTRRIGPGELDLGALAAGLGARPDHLGRFDPRARVLFAALLALTIVSLTSPASAGAGLLAALGLALLAGVSLRGLRYLLPFELLLFVLLLTLPFSVPGEPVFVMGPLTASAEGVRLAALIVLKANAVVLALLGLVAVLGPAPAIHALGRLGAPAKLCELLSLTLRQIALVADEYQRMRQAMRARAFVARSDRQTWRALGWLIGMLLVRSMMRGQRVSEAMRCRGFDGRLHLLQLYHWRRDDTALLAGATVACAALVAADRWHGVL